MLAWVKSSLCVIRLSSSTRGTRLTGEKIYSGSWFQRLQSVDRSPFCRPKVQQNIMAVEICGLGGCLPHSNQEAMKERERSQGHIPFHGVPRLLFLPPPYNVIHPHFISLDMIKTLCKVQLGRKSVHSSLQSQVLVHRWGESHSSRSPTSGHVTEAGSVERNDCTCTLACDQLNSTTLAQFGTSCLGSGDAHSGLHISV